MTSPSLVHSMSTGPPLAQGMGDGGGMGAPIVMVVVMVVFVVLVIGAVALLIRALMRRSGDASGSAADPEEVLSRRLAEGEIDDEEYRRRRSILADRG